MTSQNVSLLSRSLRLNPLSPCQDQRQLPQRTLNALLKAVAAQQQFQQAQALRFVRGCSLV